MSTASEPQAAKTPRASRDESPLTNKRVRRVVNMDVSLDACLCQRASARPLGGRLTSACKTGRPASGGELGADDLLVHGRVPATHGLGGELPRLAPALGGIDLVHSGDGRGHFVEVLADEAADAVDD